MLLVHDLPVKLYSPSNFNSEFHPPSSEDIRLYGLGRFPIARFLTAVTATAERERCVGRPAGPPSPPRRRRLRFCALSLPACLPASLGVLRAWRRPAARVLIPSLASGGSTSPLRGHLRGNGGRRTDGRRTQRRGAATLAVAVAGAAAAWLL